MKKRLLLELLVRVNFYVVIPVYAWVDKTIARLDEDRDDEELK